MVNYNFLKTFLYLLFFFFLKIFLFIPLSNGIICLELKFFKQLLNEKDLLIITFSQD